MSATPEERAFIADYLASTKPNALDVARSDAAFYAKTLIQFRQTLTFVKEGMEDEGDRIYFGSTNHADDLTKIIEKIEDLEWEQILASSQPPVDLYALLAEQRSRADKAEATVAELKGKLERATEALTPTSETKAAYWGEFHFDVEDADEDGEPCTRAVTVPWIIVKEIMAAILARASLSTTGAEK